MTEDDRDGRDNEGGSGFTRRSVLESTLVGALAENPEDGYDVTALALAGLPTPTMSADPEPKSILRYGGGRYGTGIYGGRPPEPPTPPGPPDDGGTPPGGGPLTPRAPPRAAPTE